MPNETNEQGTVRYIRCTSCGGPNPATAPNCARCGKPLHGAGAPLPVRPVASPEAAAIPAQVVCPKCGKNFPAGSKFCGYCGSPLPAEKLASPAPPTGEIRVSPTSGAAVRSSVAAPSHPPRPPVKPVGSTPKSTAVPPPPTRTAPAAVKSPTAGKPGFSGSAQGAAGTGGMHLGGSTPVGPASHMPMAVPPSASIEGTVVFTGFRVPKIEACIIEKKSDGSMGKSQLIAEEIVIGRSECDVNYEEDLMLSPRHASLAVREGRLFVRDLDSQNGTFVRQRQDSELLPGDIFLLGGELFRFTTQVLEDSEQSPQGTLVWTGPAKGQRGPVSAKLEHIKPTGEVVAEFKLEKPETTLGRTTGDLVFSDDRFMSGTHARVIAQPGRFLLQDLRSRNGVYRRIRTEVELLDGDEFFLGEHIFCVKIKNLE